jgi:hypothetical protein
MTTEPATITVTRSSAEDVGFRQIFVSLDGESIAILRNGESVTRRVPPGPHVVRAHNTMMRKTIELELRDGERATFVAVNRAGWGTFSVLALLGAGPIYLTLERVPPTPTDATAPVQER